MFFLGGYFMKFIITFARPYNFTDTSGRVVSGVKINYLPIENMKPITDEDSKGVQTCEQSVPTSLFAKIVKAPAVYDCETSIQIKKGVATISITDLKFVSEL